MMSLIRGLALAVGAALLLCIPACGGSGSTGPDDTPGPAQWDGATWDGATWEE